MAILLPSVANADQAIDMYISFKSIRKMWSWLGHLRTRRPRKHSSHLGRRRYIGAMVLLLLLVGGTSYFWYFTTDKRVRLQVIKALQEVTGGEVELESASLTVLREIRIKGLRIYLPNRPHKEENLVLGAQDVIVEHVPWSILTRNLQLKTVVVYGPRLQVWYDQDNQLVNLQLLPLQIRDLEQEFPSIYLRNGTVEYLELVKGQPTRKSQQMFNGRIFPSEDYDKLIHFEVTNNAQGVLQGSSLQGRFNLVTKRLQTRGNFLLELIDFANLPGQVVQWQQLYKIGQPTGQVETFSSYDPDTGHQVRLSLKGGELNIPIPDVKLPLQNVDAEILCTNERVVIEKLNGRYENHCDFDVTGTIEGYSREAAFDLVIKTQNLEIPKGQWLESGGAVEVSGTEPPVVVRQAAGPPMDKLLQLLPEKSRKLVTDLAPTGRLDMYLHLQRAQAEPMGRVNYKGILNLDGASANYIRFPYQVEQVHGEVVFEPGRVSIGPFLAQQGARKARIEGLWQSEKDQASFNIVVQVSNLPVDEKLFAALRPWQRKLWDRFKPAGVVNAVYEQTRQNKKKSHESLDIDLLNVQACFADFPMPLTAIRGSARYENDRVSFDINQAQAGSGRLALKGNIVDIRQQGQLDCEIDFHNLELDDKFAGFLPARSGNLYKKTGLRGRAEGRVHLYGTTKVGTDNHYCESGDRESGDPNANDPWGDIDYRIIADLYEGRILYKAFPYELQEVRANVELSKERLLVRSLSGRHGKSQIELDGYIRNKNNYQWHISAKPLELDDKLRMAFGQEEFRIWDDFRPGGQINLILDIEEHGGFEPEEISSAQKSYTATIEPLNCRLQPAFFAYPFVNVNGKVVVTPEGIEIDKLTSTDGQMWAGVSGKFERGAQEQKYHLDIEAETLEMNDEFREALPKTLREKYDLLELAGRIGADLQITGRRAKNKKGVWDFTGQAWVGDGKISWPARSDKINGKFQGKGSYDIESETLKLSGVLEAQSLRIIQRPLTNLTALVEYEGVGKELQVNQISSGFCDGRMAGQMRADFNVAPAGYGFDLQFNDVDLALLLESSKPENEKRKNLRGQLAGRMNVSKPGELADRRGTFLFAVKDAVLGELPIMARLLHVLNLSLPKVGAFNEASIKGDVVGEIVRFDPIYLRGSAVALVGAGIMTDPNNHLELVFEVESPHKLPKMPIISSFIKAIRPSLVQVQVSGNFEDPQVEPVAFPSLDKALRELSGELPPPPAQRRK